MYAEGLVTGQRPASTGKIPLRMSKDGHGVIQDAHARYQQAVYDGKVWIGANPSGTAVTTQAGVSATTPALTLYNPVGSGKLGVLWEVGYVITASPAAATGFMLAANVLNATAPSSTTDGTMLNAGTWIAGASPTLRCYRVATLAAAPVAFKYLGGVTGASAISGYQSVYEIAGGIIVPPGLAISIQTTAAAAILAHFKWEEIDL